LSFRLIHDLGLKELRMGYAHEIDGFFLPTFWWLKRKDAHGFLENVVEKGGIKKLYNIPHDVIFIAGSDRTFFRDIILELREQVLLNPDVIQVHDYPLDPTDDEENIIQKLAVNRVTIETVDEWLRANGFRERFMLLGVAQGDSPEAYLEEARFIAKRCEVVGIPIAGLASRKKYRYILRIFEVILREIDKPVMAMGWGGSNLKAIAKLAQLTRKLDANIWLEGSTVIRNSINRRVLCIRSGNKQIEYQNVRRVKGAEKFSPKDCFKYNDKILGGLLQKLVQQVETA